MNDWANESGFSSVAARIAGELARRGERLVLAESCTGGLAAAALASVSGISDWFCGSAVTYRSRTKIEWLGVGAATLEEHKAVSQVATREMALGVLGRTPEANWAAAITGHLGPKSPNGMDGRIFIAVVRRHAGKTSVVLEREASLTTATRQSRQCEAAHALLSACLTCLVERE